MMFKIQGYYGYSIFKTQGYLIKKKSSEKDTTNLKS